ncbi:hypothetical protein BJ741DRAFT_663680 [Chytriomyces cf. hyalinus JEL632]|nr:hypothetical protein BJ741DRAFT_663680 [Chytriomyces cf. hyalinus JEL632]
MDMGYLISPSARSPTEPPVSAVSFADGDALPSTLPNPSIPPSLPITTSTNSNNSHNLNELTLKRPSNPLPSVLVSPTDEASSILISLAATPPAAAGGQSVSADCESHGVKRRASSLADAVSPSDHFYSQSASTSSNYFYNGSSSNDKVHSSSITKTASVSSDTDSASKRIRHFSEDKMSLSYSKDSPIQTVSNHPNEFSNRGHLGHSTLDATALPTAPRLSSSSSALSLSSPRPLDSLPLIATSTPSTPDFNRPRLPSLSSIMESHHSLHTPSLPPSSTNSSRSSLPSTTPPSSSLLNPHSTLSNASLSHKHRRTVSSPAPSLHRTVVSNHRYSSSVGNAASGSQSGQSATLPPPSGSQSLSSSSTASINSNASTTAGGGGAMIFGIPGSPVGAYKPKFKYSEAQKQVLIREFEVNQYPNFEKKDELARATGTTATQVQFWFQNQRQKVARKEGSARPVAWVSEFVGKK